MRNVNSVDIIADYVSSCYDFSPDHDISYDIVSKVFSGQDTENDEWDFVVDSSNAT